MFLLFRYPLYKHGIRISSVVHYLFSSRKDSVDKEPCTVVDWGNSDRCLAVDAQDFLGGL